MGKGQEPTPVDGASPLTVDQALLLWGSCPDWLCKALAGLMDRQDALANLMVGD